MNCEETNDLLSVFMDNELDDVRASEVRAHLAICVPCAKVCEDLAAILDVCHTEPPSEILPPNSQAMWCRINNLIESDVKSNPPEMLPVRKRWNLTLPQLASVVLSIALISSILTVFAISNYVRPEPNETVRSAATQTTFEKILSRVGLADTPQQARERRIREQQAAIDYWNQRVQARRAQWDNNLRDAFDRNLHVIDESVSEYTRILQQDPDDELSGEMLDSALNEKMDLLREFSEL